MTTLDHPPYSPDLAAADLTFYLDLNQHWRDSAFLMLLTLRMRRKSWKGFHKMASRNGFNTFTVADTGVWLSKGTILKEMSLKLLYCSVSVWNKVISGTFCRCHAVSLRKLMLSLFKLWSPIWGVEVAIHSCLISVQIVSGYLDTPATLFRFKSHQCPLVRQLAGP